MRFFGPPTSVLIALRCIGCPVLSHPLRICSCRSLHSCARRQSKCSSSLAGHVFIYSLTMKSEKAELMDPAPKPFLEALVGQLTGTRFLIDGRRVVIGRDASECQIALGQNAISKVQAAFELGRDQQSSSDRPQWEANHIRQRPTNYATAAKGWRSDWIWIRSC